MHTNPQHHHKNQPISRAHAIEAVAPSNRRAYTIPAAIAGYLGAIALGIASTSALVLVC